MSGTRFSIDMNALTGNAQNHTARNITTHTGSFFTLCFSFQATCKYLCVTEYG
jgi:hypothetical protein